ncbi:MAG: propionyl-CoA synthetase [Mameliella sp.]|nr:propionyl-CoA synthetase [Mameliella sp.]|tara:strand:- start:7983 stop:9872 length:1890 start_codon:yes stop_codon:yes gene_type:complete
MSYADSYNRSIADPEGFWAEAATGISWDRPWEKVVDLARPNFPRWFAGARLNTCFNALDRHVASGRGAQTALIHDSPVTGTIRHLSYTEMLDQTARFAGGLRDMGVEKGDRVVIYMPAVPEAVIAMLACARIGAIHSVVFGGFAAQELAKRIEDAGAKVVVSASCGIEGQKRIAYKPLLDEAIMLSAHKPERCIILQRPEMTAMLSDGRDMTWSDAMGEPVEAVPVDASHPLYILYTSGTTGQPKGVVRDNAGHAVVLKWTMENLYGVKPGEVFWAASDIGWQVGHSYITYGPMLHGATAVLYEGKPVGTPDAGAFWRVIEQHNVRTLFTAPTAIRAIRREDPHGLLLKDHDLANLRALFLAGERTDPDTLKWASTHLQVPVIDHWWQTETGWPIAGNPIGIEELPIKPGSTAVPMPGWQVRCVDETGSEMPRGKTGDIVIREPMAPGALLTLWNADQRYVDSYFSQHPGHYASGDNGYIDEDGYIFILNRTDDVINVAGHRLSTGLMEEVVATHPDVAECAVVGVADRVKGQMPVGLLVLKSGINPDPARLEREVIALVRKQVGPVASFKHALTVKRLPKTRSGKILRKTIREIADGADWKMPATIEDPSALDEIDKALKNALDTLTA